MPPKLDTSKLVICKFLPQCENDKRVHLKQAVKAKVFGGEPGPAATLAPKLGPLGLVITLGSSS